MDIHCLQTSFSLSQDFTDFTYSLELSLTALFSLMLSLERTKEERATKWLKK